MLGGCRSLGSFQPEVMRSTPAVDHTGLLLCPGGGHAPWGTGVRLGKGPRKRSLALAWMLAGSKVVRWLYRGTPSLEGEDAQSAAVTAQRSHSLVGRGAFGGL